MQKSALFRTSKLLIVIFVLMTFSAIIYGIACHWTSNDAIAHYLFANADLMLVPYASHNLIYQHGHFYDWSFPNAPYFFPDMIVIFLTSLIFKNIYINFLIFALLQMTFFVLIIAMLFKTLTQRNYGFRFGIITGFLCLLLLAKSAANTSYSDYLSALLTSGLHFGSNLMVLLALFLLIKYLEKGKRFLLILLSLFIILTSISDPLMTYYFVPPAIMALMIVMIMRHFEKNKLIKSIAVILMSGIISYICYKHLPLPVLRGAPKINFHLHYFPELFYLLKEFLAKNIIVSIFWLGFLILAPFFIFFQFKNKKELLIDFVILFQFMLQIWGIIAALLIHNGSNMIVLRYAYPLIYGPAFIGFPLLLIKIGIARSLKKELIYAPILLIMLTIALWNNPPLQSQNLVNYYPPYLACFDHYVEKYHLHAGVAGYWQAKPMTVYNHSGARVVAVVPANMALYHWINTLQPYRKGNFDFVVKENKVPSSQTFDLKHLISRFGKPTHTFVCGDYTFYAYTNGAMKGLFPLTEINRLRI